MTCLKAGPVTQAQLKGLNERYPSDPVYYVRTQLKVNVHTVRTVAGTVYMTDEIFKTYSEGLAKEKAAADAAKAAAKAEASPKEVPRQTRYPGKRQRRSLPQSQPEQPKAEPEQS